MNHGPMDSMDYHGLTFSVVRCVWKTLDLDQSPAPRVQVKVDDLSTPPLWHSDVVPPASGVSSFRGFRGRCPWVPEFGEGVKP